MSTYLVKNYARQSKLVCAASPVDAARIANFGGSVTVTKISDVSEQIHAGTRKLPGNMLGTKFFKD